MTSQQQSAIRMALAMCAADKTSEMNIHERQWVIDRLTHVNSEGGHPDLEDHEVVWIRGPLLSWAYQRDVAFGKQLQAHLEGGAIPKIPKRGTQLDLVERPTAEPPHQPTLATPLTRKGRTYGSTERHER